MVLWNFCRRQGGGNLAEGAIRKVGKSRGLAALTSASAVSLAYSGEQPVGTWTWSLFNETKQKPAPAARGHQDRGTRLVLPQSAQIRWTDRGPSAPAVLFHRPFPAVLASTWAWFRGQEGEEDSGVRVLEGLLGCGWKLGTRGGSWTAKDLNPNHIQKCWHRRDCASTSECAPRPSARRGRQC